MADERTEDNVVELRAGTKENPNGVSKSGKPLVGAAGRPISEEHRRKLLEGRARKKAERERLKEAEKAGRSVTPKEAREQALDRLKPAAVKALEELLNNRHGVHCPECDAVLQVLTATPPQIVSAAKVVLEHTEGRPAQKIQVEKVDVIEYRLAEHEPPHAESA